MVSERLPTLPLVDVAPEEPTFGRVERAGQRVFRELAPSRVMWSTVGELHRLVAADLVALLTPVAGCQHEEPCERERCRTALKVRAVLGNDAPGTASATTPLRSTAAGDAFTSRAVQLGGLAGAASELCPIVLNESLLQVAAVPILFDETVLGTLLVGRRNDSPPSDAEVDRIRRFAAFAGTALSAAFDRSSAEEVAVARDRHATARELHDNVGQLLFRVGVAARLARESATTGRDDVIGRMQDVEQLVGRVSATLRHMMRQLDNPGSARVAVAASISEEIESVRHRTGIHVYLLTVGELRSLPPETEGLVVRIAAEGLRNVERHSRAREAIVSLGFEDERVTVAVQDNGVGPGQSPGESTGLGIRRLREEARRHGGELTLTRNEDGGTTLRAWLEVSE